MTNAPSANGYRILGPVREGYEEILTPDAMDFLAELARRFGPQVDELLARRKARQAEIDAGKLPDFLPETADIRAGDWRVGEIPADLQDRRVEITGPVDRKMIINALNSGAKVFMADFEDSMTPAWDNLIPGQVALRDAVARTISFTSPEGKQYQLNDEVATLFVRPRGWHLFEKHVEVDGRQVPGGLFDFGLYLFHNARATKQIDSGPYFYLPKLESHLEARLWAEVFRFAEDTLGLARGTIKCTVLIETILAAFEIDEILYELREHIVGLNCGRWDYIFSFIKKFQDYPEFVLPDRAPGHHDDALPALLLAAGDQDLSPPRRAARSAAWPRRSPSRATRRPTRPRWPRCAPTRNARRVTAMTAPGWRIPAWFPWRWRFSTSTCRSPTSSTACARTSRSRPRTCCRCPKAEITEAGLRSNVTVGIQYMAAWLGGNGCVPLYNLMEDAATAEISRAQVWQWIRHPQGVLDDGRKVT